MSLPDHIAKQMPEKLEKVLDKLPDSTRDLLTKAGRGPVGLVTDLDVHVRITEEIRADGQVVTYSGLQIEASPSAALSIDGVFDLDSFSVEAQVDGVFMNDQFAGLGITVDPFAAFQPDEALDTHGILNPETRPGYVGTVELAPGASVHVRWSGEFGQVVKV